MGTRKNVCIPTELMQKIAKGDNKAFEELYYLTYKPLYSFLLSMTKNHEDASDLMQETYIKVRGACHLYKDNNPMAWIMKIAKNQFLMDLRKKKNVQFCSYDEYFYEISANVDGIKKAEDRIYLEKLLNKIPSDELEIIVMHISMGLKHKEISEILDIPLGTVLSKYHRAIKKLKNIEQEVNYE